MEQEQREQLRSEYKLRALTSEEEGRSIHKLPHGVYGFSYAPATETPLFARRSCHSFEVHKLSDGSAHIVAFVSPADADRIRSREHDVEITIYPDPHQDATLMVSVPFARVLNSLYKPIRHDGNAVPLKLAGA